MSTLSSAYLIPILIMPNHKRKITKPRKISSPLTALVSPPLWSLVHLSCARPRRPVSAVQAVVWELKEWIQPSHPCPASTPGRTGRLRGLNQYPAISQTGSPELFLGRYAGHHCLPILQTFYCWAALKTQSPVLWSEVIKCFTGYFSLPWDQSVKNINPFNSLV